MLAKIIACQPAEPGTAQLMVRLRGEQALLTNLTFILCNNEQHYLQPDGSWSPAPHKFTIGNSYPLNSGSGFRIGSTLLDPLLANASQVQIQVELDSGETRNTTLQLVRDELFSSGARGQTGDYSSSSVLTTSEPDSASVTTPEPMPVSESLDQPEPEPELVVLPPLSANHDLKRKSQPSRVPLIAAALLIVLLIAVGGVWWFLGRDATANAPNAVDTQQDVTAVASLATAAEDNLATSDCSPTNLNSQKELDFVQRCVQQKLDSDKYLDIIQAAKNANKCGVAQRLYANRAQGGDSKIALAYASEYDPKDHQPNQCFKEADRDTAVYWYETVLQFEPDNQKAKQRLEDLRK
ncbi:hypothetical protein U1R68_17895 [Pectobacterium colocasium]|uniref:hypothetical protein n=1 Tax=Pectobacterium colocasium TaxID=2878098 RepID=UPI001CD32EE0|nr:hypothetical protein [Pectobacterium colocasium]